MTFILKNKDIDLIKFEVIENIEVPVIKILEINERHKNLIPLDIQLTNDSIVKWIRRRNIPKNRAFVNEFLSKQGLSPNRPIDIIKVSKGLSLIDNFWIVEDGFKGKYKDYNLYDNKFSRILAQIVFTGYGSSNRKITSSPEYTTDGALPKCWRREKRKIFLYKGGTSGASNTGREPTSEALAYQVGEEAGFNIIKYTLVKWKKISGKYCSKCELFTSKEYSYMAIGRLVKEGGMTKVREYYNKLGKEFVNALNEMIIFDAIICNTDRHFGNFGVLIDNKKNIICKPAPLFDHGNSLLNFASNDIYKSDIAFNKYVDIQKPSTYDDFMEEAKKYITKDIKAKLRKLYDFKFKRDKKYLYTEKQISKIEKMIRERAIFLTS